MPEVAQITAEKITPLIESMGYEVVDVEYVKKTGVFNLTVFIDVPNGITLEDCEKVHVAIDPLLDELDPTGGVAYTLNVSSPGLDRPFKKHRDYERNYGREVEVKLYAPMKGNKLFEGVLVSYNENVTTINCNGTDMALENTKIAKVCPLVKFE